VPKKVTDKLQQVRNDEVRLITVTQKHERGLSRLLNDDLHWLTIPQQVQYSTHYYYYYYKLAVTVHQCLRHQATSYLANCCLPVSEVSGCQTEYYTDSLQHNWHPGFLSHRSNSLELAA